MNKLNLLTVRNPEYIDDDQYTYKDQLRFKIWPESIKKANTEITKINQIIAHLSSDREIRLKQIRVKS